MQTLNAVFQIITQKEICYCDVSNTTTNVSYYLFKKRIMGVWMTKSHLFRKANTILYFYIYKF